MPFLKYLAGPFSRSLRSNDLGWLNFEVATSEVWHCFSKFGSSPQKGKVDLCTTNGSKVLIYLTLQYFKFYCTHVSNAKGNIAKSNKSEIWNCLSYRGLPYLFEVRSQTFCNSCKLSRSQPQNLTTWGHLTSDVESARLQPQNFAIVPESLALHLKKVK